MCHSISDAVVARRWCHWRVKLWRGFTLSNPSFYSAFFSGCWNHALTIQPLKSCFPNRKVVFPASFFRGELFNIQGVCLFFKLSLEFHSCCVCLRYDGRAWILWCWKFGGRKSSLRPRGTTFPVGGPRTLQKTNIFSLFKAFLKCCLDKKRPQKNEKMSGFVLFTVTVMYSFFWLQCCRLVFSEIRDVAF